MCGCELGARLLSALDHVKPGDTTYITVIRPLHGGYHRTMRIALHIDYETDAAGNNPTGISPAAAVSDRKRGELNRPTRARGRGDPASCINTGCRGQPLPKEA